MTLLFMSSCSAAMCLGGRGFNCCWRLRYFVCPTLVSYWKKIICQRDVLPKISLDFVLDTSNLFGKQNYLIPSGPVNLKLWYTQVKSVVLERTLLIKFILNPIQDSVVYFPYSHCENIDFFVDLMFEPWFLFLFLW